MSAKRGGGKGSSRGRRRGGGLSGAVDICVYYTAQDDPRKNTAVRMQKQGQARLVDDIKHVQRHSVLLNPFAKKAISAEDLPMMRKNGLVALDCSWRQAEEMFPLLQGEVRSRALPFLVAASPAKFGTPFELSTAEALAAALYIAGEQRQAKRILKCVPWADTFWEVNAQPLADYAACTTSTEVVAAQALFLRDEEE